MNILDLSYNPEMIVPRDVMLYFMISTTLLALASVASTLLVSFPR